MSSHSLQISQHLRNKVRLDGAEAWLRDLPALVADLEREWSITVGPALDGGHEAFVAEATMEDGTPAVLKVLVPQSDDVARHEITVLRLVDGEASRNKCVEIMGVTEALVQQRLGLLFTV